MNLIITVMHADYALWKHLDQCAILQAYCDFQMTNHWWPCCKCWHCVSRVYHRLHVHIKLFTSWIICWNRIVFRENTFVQHYVKLVFYVVKSTCNSDMFISLVSQFCYFIQQLQSQADITLLPDRTFTWWHLVCTLCTKHIRFCCVSRM